MRRSTESERGQTLTREIKIMEDSQVEFLAFDETPAEKYLGVASLRFFGQIILRYKVQQTKDGHGIFIAAPSFKKTDQSGEHWCQWFMLDSMSHNETVTNLIKMKVKAHYNTKNGPTQNGYGSHSTSRGWGSQSLSPQTA